MPTKSRKVGKPRGRNGGRPVTTGTGTRVTFRASEHELALIKAAALAAGVTAAQFAKRAAVVATRTPVAKSTQDDELVAHHIDGDPNNNAPENLRWETLPKQRVNRY